MSKLIRYGMVGGGLNGFIGDVHRKAASFDSRLELVAGCFSTHPDQNAATGDACGIAPDRLYENYREMAEKEAAREDGIDFVTIVTPNFCHYEIAKAFLQAGINIVCEKPVCFEVAEAEELEALAKEKDLLFAVTYTYPGFTMPRIMKDMIAQGEIGRIVSVNGEYVQEWLINDLNPVEGMEETLSTWRREPKIAGISNCVGDIGTHIECLVSYVTGLKIKRLAATMNRFGQELDLNANILIEYDTGINGAYWCSQIAAGHYNDLVIRIYGDKGSLEWHEEHPDFLNYTPKGGATRTITRAGNETGYPAAEASRLPSGHPEGLYVAFANIYRDYVTALIDKKAGRPYDVSRLTMIDAGVDGVRFVHAAVDSAAADSAWVELR
ncbi:MAG: Gfo/Idh/MocA family protein [Massiliimalia sp.]|jgi:predicted dehydrogenase